MVLMNKHQSCAVLMINTMDLYFFDDRSQGKVFV